MTRETWDKLTPLFRDISYRQIGSYAAAAACRVGAKSELNGLYEGDTLVGLADVRVKTIPLMPLGIGYLSHAPVISQDGDFSVEKFARCVEAIRKEYVGRRRLLLRVVPTLAGGQFQDVQTAALEAQGFRLENGQTARQTFLLDLTEPMTEIRKKADQHWRRNLAKAEKAAIKITRSTEPDDFDRFEPIFLELTKQKSFSANQDVRFFKEVQANTAQEQKLVLHLAWHGEELIAGHLGSFTGDTAIYLLGAANALGRELRASYLLHWRVIEYACNCKNSYYDLGGIDQEHNPGVFRFKQGLNGRAVQDLGPYEFSPNGLTSGVLHLVERAKNAIRR
jgi:lipid II:glycine glycyltransferase (peptidoglycan interpeptide bridge formation enzyme)